MPNGISIARIPNTRWARIVACVAASSLVVNASMAGVADMTSWITDALRQHFAVRPGPYTDRPTPVYRGDHPGRDPHGRGIWTKKQLEDVADSHLDLQASIGGVAPPPTHTLAVAAEPGTPYPWEGAMGSLNTGNGNKLTPIHLTGWKCRGDLSVDFTLYQNSETNYNDELGHGWTWTYDIYINFSGSTATVHWGDGLSVPYHINTALPPGLDTYDEPAGIHDELVKNGNGTYTLTKKDGVKYQFNTAGFCTAIQDRNGNQITITLNTGNYATAITDPSGRQITITLDGTSSKFDSITTPDGETWSFTRNGSSDMTTVTWPQIGVTTYTDGFTYNAAHDILTHTDKRGKVWTFTYNTDGSLATQVDALSHTTSYTYTAPTVTITDPLSHTVVDSYSSGKLASRQDESSYSDAYTYDSDNNVLTNTDKRGKVWTYTYDTSGNVLTVEDPLTHVTEYTYNGFSEVLTKEDALGHTWTNTYDTNGNLLTSTDPISRTTVTNTYTGYGQLDAITDALSNVTDYDYDTDGNLVTITDPLLHQTTMDYDSMSRLTDAADPLSHTESIAYDEWGRPVTYTHEDASTITKTYNANSQVTAVTDELSHATTLVYDDAGRLTSTTNAENETETYGYDNADRRTTVTNGRNKTRTYTYTNRGEPYTLTLADSSVETWSYNANGDVSAYTNPLSQTISYAYDDASRQTAVDYPTGTDTSFGYDNADRQTSMVDSTGTTTWTYNNANEVTQLATPQGTMSYTYYADGRRNTMVDSAGTTTYSYDDDGRLTSLQNQFSETTTFAYDNAHRLTTQTFDTGQYESFGYDNRDRQTSVDHKKSNNTVISGESYVYDDASNLTSATRGGVTTTYTYDDIDQLLTESRSGYSATYTYDANGNRASKTLGGSTDTYNYDDADKLTSITNGGSTVKSYTYDAAGRTHTVVVGANTTTIDYDYEGRITTITYPNSSTNTFTYNGLDTRVGKVDSSGTSTYKRDGVAATSPVITDGSATYTSGISERRAGTSKYFSFDRICTNALETNGSQIVTATRQYDAFGVLVGSSGSASSPFGYAAGFGYQEDSDSGLKLLGHRYYDASTGRFLTSDPVKDGRNWYAYADNNPTKHVDPTGEFIPLLIAAVLIVGVLSIGSAEAPTHAGEVHDAGKFGREKLGICIMIAMLATGRQAAGPREGPPGESPGTSPGEGYPMRELPRGGKGNNPIPDPAAEGRPHSQLGWRLDPKQSPEPYPVTRTWPGEGRLPIDRHGSTHGRGDHVPWHEHQWRDPSMGRGGTWSPGRPKPPGTYTGG